MIQLILFAPLSIASALVLPEHSHPVGEGGAQDCPREAARFSHASLEYRSWVTQYRHGRPDAARSDAAGLTARQLDDVLAGAFLPKLCRADPPWEPAEVRAAAMYRAVLNDGIEWLDEAARLEPRHRAAESNPTRAPVLS